MYCIYQRVKNDKVLTLEAECPTSDIANQVKCELCAIRPECRFIIICIQGFAPTTEVDLRDLITYNPGIDLSDVLPF